MTFASLPHRIGIAMLAAALLLGGCVSAVSPANAPANVRANAPELATTSRPKLVVFIAIDGLPQRQVVDYRDQLAPDGFRRFLDRGTWFSDAHYRHGNTQTAPGHATMLTGAYPHRTGIIANEWRNPETGEMVYNTGDTAYTYIGHKTQKLDGTSPRNLRVETVGDVLRRVDPRSKVISMSGKDRGAILPGGKTGTAYMYMSDSGTFASTTYYMPAHPAWVDRFNAGKPADAYLGRTWRPLLDDAAYAKSLPDGQPWYAKGGKLPKTVGEGLSSPTPQFYQSLLPSPFADALTLDFARAAIAGESLGADDSPDILSISLSSHDYVNHAYSAESRLSHDHILQLDRLLEAFFHDLDRTVGRDNVLLVLTADHGFMPAPEFSRSLGRDAGKQNGTELLAHLNAGLSRRFGEGKYATAISAMGILLDRNLVASKGIDRSAFDTEAKALMMAEPGVQAVFSRSELESGARAGDPTFDALRRTWDSARSGDLQFALKPWWMMSSSSAATHGSTHPYDTNVPILLYGPRWVGAGRVDTTVEVPDIAPTLARILGVPAPSAAEGKPLPLRNPG